MGAGGVAWLSLTSIAIAAMRSSTLIAYHSRLELAYPLATHLLDRIADPDEPLSGYRSMITASELFVRPIRSGSERVTFMHDFLTNYPGLTLLPVDLMVAMQAATLRSTRSVRLPDALIVATGLLAGCEAIVGNDERWRRRFAPLCPQFRWLYPGDYLPV